MKRIISYNVNGIRAAEKKGWSDWAKASNADIICLQEVKANLDQVNLDIFTELGYHYYWYPAQKKGYSGVAILTKEKPKHIEYGCGIQAYDDEGRILRADFEGYSVISVYIPSGSSGELRQSFKMQFLEDFFGYVKELKKDIPNLVISGDYNICHKPIDIHNPVSNKKTSGFLPEEREWLSHFIENAGFEDSFRTFNADPDCYSWWSYRAASRTRNKGWRIDYNMVSSEIKNKITRSAILKDAVHSDHCPILVEIDY